LKYAINDFYRVLILMLNKMKLIPFKITLISIAILAALVSCNKTEDNPPQYLRGGNSLALADDGNLIVAGYTSITNKGYDAVLLLANSSNGDTIWSHNYGGSYSDAFYSVKKSNDGGIIATGFTNRASAGSPTMVVVITDANGKVIKSKSYGGSYYSQGFCVMPNADSGYLVTGYIQKSTNADRDIYLVRINDSGDTLWTKTIGAKSTDPYDTVNDAAYSVIPAPDGGYFLTGSLNGYNQNGGKIFLMKVSATGDSLWTRTFGVGIGFSLTNTQDGGVAIAGTLTEGATQDIFLLKTDTAGTLLWSKAFIGNGYEYGATMVETSDGGFGITGITDSKGSGYQDVYLIRTDAIGGIIWDKTYGGGDIDQGFGLIELGAGEFSITGLSNTGGSFIFLNRTSADGTQVWQKNIQY
jgi:hypothetical protein